MTSVSRRRRRFEFAPHNCFACGTLNTHGLQLTLHLEPARSWTTLELDRRFEGWEGVAHGGIVCTILDEVMAWALVADDDWGVTARMAVEFRKPVPIGRPIRAEGWVTRSRRRLVETAGRIVDTESGVELATATGTYVAADRGPQAGAPRALRLPPAGLEPHARQRRYARHAWTRNRDRDSDRRHPPRPAAT